jgi:hypothetical protein
VAQNSNQCWCSYEHDNEISGYIKAGNVLTFVLD